MSRKRPAPRCSHVTVYGAKCGAPALKGGRLCYYHANWRQNQVDFKQAAPTPVEPCFEIPPLDSTDAIRLTLLRTLTSVLAERITLETAGLILYALQIAASNLGRIELSAPAELIRQIEMRHPSLAELVLSMVAVEETVSSR